MIMLLLSFFLVTNLSAFNYPKTQKSDTVDILHGVQVPDPYRWLEDAKAPETQAWTEKQNELTQNYLNSSHDREKIKQELTDLWNYSKISLPSRYGHRYFFWKNTGLQNQHVLYSIKSLDDNNPVTVIDPNNLSDDGTIAIAGTAISHDGNLMAYKISNHGSDWKTIKIRDLRTGKDYDDHIKWCKFSDIGWKADNSGFFYNRFAEDGSPENKVYFHKLGSEQAQDSLVFEEAPEKPTTFIPGVTEDGNYLVLCVLRGTDPNNAYYIKRIDSSEPFTKLFTQDTDHYEFVGNIKEKFYFITTNSAPQGRLITLDLKNPQNIEQAELIGQQKDKLEDVTLVNNHFVCTFMHDASHHVKLYDLKGRFQKTIKLPTLGSVSVSGKQKSQEFFIQFQSFLYPGTVFRYDFLTKELKLLWKNGIEFDASEYQTKQIFCNSKDGTKIPVFLTYKKNIKLDGNNPTLVYAYGGFGISQTPFFSNMLAFIKHNGVLAVANIRGGGEYGREWHDGAKGEKRQNGFDDFIATGQWLIVKKYTKSSKLGIWGGSNGGLLVAACSIQRPDLFGAVISQVPVTDMLRFHKFTAGCYWVPEYGDPENPEHFKHLFAYSPVHNVKKGVTHPPMLILSADTDDRVVPLHAKKFTAVLQEYDSGKNPILLRIETKAGHGDGKPTSKRIEEVADIFTFLFKTFGMTCS